MDNSIYKRYASLYTYAGEYPEFNRQRFMEAPRDSAPYEKYARVVPDGEVCYITPWQYERGTIEPDGIVTYRPHSHYCIKAVRAGVDGFYAHAKNHEPKLIRWDSDT